MRQGRQPIDKEVSQRLRAFVLVLFLCSGVSSLFFEVVWTRLLTVILGNTVYAVSTVLSVFMAGLALGSVLGGRLVDRRTDSLRVYALLEMGVGLSGFLVTSLLDQTGPAYVAVQTALRDHPLALGAARFGLVSCLLAFPTTLMGATLPALSKFLVEHQRRLGLDTGSLYALNTLGAAAGCYLAGFVLIGNVGMRATISLASALSIAAGGLAWVCHTAVGAARPELPTVPRDEEAGKAIGPLRLVVLAAFAVSGFAALGYEVVWTRILLSYLGSSVYAFSTMLTAFLTGLALGSFGLSQVVDGRKRPVMLFGFLHAGVGVYVLLSLYVFQWYLEGLGAARNVRPVWEGTGPRFLKAFALMLVPTVLMGAMFPVAARIYVTSLRQLGRSLGKLYASNTVGAILGAAIAGFVFLPHFGLEGSLVILLTLNLCAAAALWLSEPGAGRRGRLFLVGALAVAAGLGLAARPRNIFRRMQELSRPGEKLIYYKEDVSGTAAVTQQGPERTLSVEGLDVAGTTETYLSSHKSLGHLPMLLHPDPRVVYVLGFGGGGTAYAVSTYPEVERIDATELNAAVVDAARLFTAINHQVTSDPRLHLIVDDGRHFLATTERTYDVVSVDLLWPQAAGSGSLYTKEFYELCRRRLDPRGIMVQWLQPSFIPTPYLQMILRTVRHVFPHTSLWWTQQQIHLLVVASPSPLRIDFQRLIRRMNEPAVRADLLGGPLGDPARFVTHFIAEGGALARLDTSSDAINSDDLPLVEYQLPLHTASARLENVTAIGRIRESVLPLIEDLTSEQREQILRCEQANRRLHQALIAVCEGRLADAKADCREALRIDPANRDAKDSLEALERARDDSRPPVNAQQ